MTKTQRLYGKGFDKKYLKMQIEICNYKLKRLEVVLNELLSVNMYARDDERIRDILNARDWNESVIKESEELLR